MNASITVFIMTELLTKILISLCRFSICNVCRCIDGHRGIHKANHASASATRLNTQAGSSRVSGPSHSHGWKTIKEL